MGKSYAQRQKEYKKLLKERNLEMYLEQDRDRKRIQGEALKKTAKYEDYKAKNRMRKRKKSR